MSIWTYLNDYEPTAKKDYVCTLCGLIIGKGTKHIKRCGVQDGEMISMRMHNECEALTNDWGDEEWECRDCAEFRGALKRNV